ncbi:MAG: prepilin-type N-terminal cleavage/methylation domain-containing protein [Elusimicrobia bacterium]|nr:prepilin-type N-terminal cleavage/methylation domain-containing protein [Elusimicrobiota bacterium]MDY6039657.1 prepilin-type N-terminal cleavage/methylation domain-containing protein [Elusimicrobiaceae bacterium]
MYQKQGFTLIELLVVVLIIGILSAVALPQYTKAVEKSRAAEALAVVRTLRTAQEAYYLANGSYTSEIKDLDVDVPGSDDVYGGVSRRKTKWFSYGLNPTAHKMIVANRLPEDKSYVFVYNGDYVFCRGYSSAGKTLCKSFGGEQVSDGGYESYKVD